MIKVCRKCKAILDAANSAPGRIKKRDYICKACASIYQREWTARDKAKSREAARLRVSRWRSKPENKAKEQQRRPGYYNPEQQKAYGKKYYLEHKEKKLAQIKLSQKIKAGKVKKEPCNICGAKKAEAHHEDYGKPLQVEWLCSKHHKGVHSARATI